MADTWTVTSTIDKRQQFGGLFSEMLTAYGGITDQTAVSDGTSFTVDLTCTGVKLGDMVLGMSIDKDTGDANANVTVHATVTAANVISVTVTNIDETTDAFDADTFNGGIWRILIGRPDWGGAI